MVFKNIDKSDFKINYICQYITKNEASLALDVCYELSEKFFLNFNLDPRTSPELPTTSVVYFNDDKEKRNPKFNFSKLNWPNPKNNMIFFAFYRGGKEVYKHFFEGAEKWPKVYKHHINKT